MARPPGVPNKKNADLKLDLLATLRSKGFDPVAALVEVHLDAKEEYRKRIEPGKTGFGAVGFMQIAEASARDIMPYVYSQLRSIEVTGKDGQDFFQSFTDLVRQIHQDKNDQLGPERSAEALPVESRIILREDPRD